MAERWAVATGNANNTATWDGGTLPATTDDVYANGFTVTVNVNTEWKSANTIAGTTAVAGGGFTLSNGVTLTLNGGAGTATAGSTTCVTYAGTSGNSATIIGHVQGSTTTGSRYGAQNSSTGTLTILGNVTGGAFGSGHGVFNNSSGIISITGNVTAGSGSGANGARNNLSTGAINVIGNVAATAQTALHYQAGSGSVTGSVTGGTASSSVGVFHNGTGTVTITGTVTGGSAALASAVANASSGTVIINGDAVGGSNATAYGLNVTAGGSATVNGAAISDVAPGVNAASSATTVQVETAETGGYAITPISGKVLFKDRTTASFGVRVASVGLVALTEAGADAVDPLYCGVIA